MVDHKHYVPILKGRQGEYGALQAMSPAVKEKLTPLIEIPPVPWDHARNRPSKTIDQHLAKIASTIQQCWGSDRAIFVDLVWNTSERMANHCHPIAYIFGAARDRGLQLIPVTSLIRDDDHQCACRDAVHRDGRGICLRLQREDFEDSQDVGRQIAPLLEILRVGPSETDLVLDLRAVTPQDANDVLLSQVPSLIQRIPEIERWRSLTLAATAFPEDLMGLPPSAVSFVPRVEWRLWRQLIAGSQLPRLPRFGDYGIAHVQPSEVDPRIMRPSASVRYTTEEDWLVLKGRNLRDFGYAQYHDLCRVLLTRPEYAGPDFSWGDWYITECADRRVRSGNLTTWRKVGTSHHLAFVTCRIASVA